MNVRGVHHVSLNVDDVDAAVAFYTEALGLTRRTDRPDFPFAGAWLDCGAQQVHLIAADVPHPTSASTSPSTWTTSTPPWPSSEREA